MNITDYEIRLKPSNMYIICEIDVFFEYEEIDISVGFRGNIFIDSIILYNAFDAQDDDRMHLEKDIKSHIINNCQEDLIKKYFNGKTR